MTKEVPSSCRMIDGVKNIYINKNVTKTLTAKDLVLKLSIKDGMEYLIPAVTPNAIYHFGTGEEFKKYLEEELVRIANKRLRELF